VPTNSTAAISDAKTRSSDELLALELEVKQLQNKIDQLIRSETTLRIQIRDLNAEFNETQGFLTIAENNAQKKDQAVDELNRYVEELKKQIELLEEKTSEKKFLAALAATAVREEGLLKQIKELQDDLAKAKLMAASELSKRLKIEEEYVK